MIRSDLTLSPFVTVISARRPGNVSAMTAMVGPATWIVDEASAHAYRNQGAEVIVGGPLCASRNVALEAAGTAPCIQLSDDLTSLALARNGKPLPITFASAVAHLNMAVDATGAKLAGAAPTTNLFYYDAAKPLASAAFIVGDFLLVMPSAPRFDERLALKEDYDFTLAHLTRYGAVARANDLLAGFKHRANAGGAVAYRTPEAEQQAIAYLRAKWGAFIQMNPRRPNEILLKVPRAPKRKL